MLALESPLLAAERTRADIACAHCGLPVPAALLRKDSDAQFCCSACDTAYHAIRACGLDDYYSLLRAGSSGIGKPARTSDSRYEQFDDPVFLQLHSRSDPAMPRRRSVRLLVEGLHCAACVWLLERISTLPELDGLIDARVDYSRSQITLSWDDSRIELSAVARFIGRLGYTLHPIREHAAREARLREDRGFVIRIGIAFALFGNAMLVAFSLYGGLSGGMEERFVVFFRIVAALLALGSVFGPGWVFFKGAFASLRVRALHMDVPIALALSVGLIHGVVNTARGACVGGGEVYFDTLCTLVFLLLIGRWIQHRQQRRAADAVELLFSLAPSSARRIEDDTTRMVPVEALRAGDLVEVGPNESLPVDGVIVRGRSTLNNALLSGESRPIEVAEGDHACAGSVNLVAPLRLRVEAAGSGTRVGKLMAMVEEHARRRAPIVRMADRIAQRFVIVVVGLAILTAALWTFIDPSHAIEHAVALLIITCPCALGLATPLAVVVAIGRAARSGIFIKGGDALEALSAPGRLGTPRRERVIVLDKTGTLTLGAARVVRYEGPGSLKPFIAAAERSCNHPIAHALVRAFDCPDASKLTPRIEHALGGGIRALFEGREVRIGSPAFVRASLGIAEDAPLPGHLERALAESIASGMTPILIAEEGAPSALIALEDEIRPEAADVVAELRAHGWRPVLLSGDDPRIARAVGTRLGIAEADIMGGAAPEQKLAFIRSCKEHGAVVMVGDGVNDAAALAAATVGIAVHGGAEAALAAADIYLTRPGIAPLLELFLGARAATRTIRRNLAASLIYNFIFAGLAVAGLVSPLLAAILMPISGITVVVLSCTARTFPRQLVATGSEAPA